MYISPVFSYRVTYTDICISYSASSYVCSIMLPVCVYRLRGFNHCSKFKLKIIYSAVVANAGKIQVELFLYVCTSIYIMISILSNLSL